jgi:hypothetical protein
LGILLLLLINLLKCSLLLAMVNNWGWVAADFAIASRRQHDRSFQREFTILKRIPAS